MASSRDKEHGPEFVSDDSDRNSRDSIEKKPEDVVPQAILQNATLVSEKGNVITKDGVVVSTQESDASLSANIFLDPEVRDHYIKLYEDAKYECRHLFDAEATWTPEEEKKLVRRLDYHGTCLAWLADHQAFHLAWQVPN